MSRTILTVLSVISAASLVSAASAQTMRASCDNRQGTTFADVVDSSDPTQDGYNIDPSEIFRAFNNISFPVSQNSGANLSSASLTLNSRFLGANPGNRMTGFISEATGSASATRSNTNTRAQSQNIINVCMDLTGASTGSPSIWRWVASATASSGTTSFSRLLAPGGGIIQSISGGSVNRVVRLTTNGQYQINSELDTTLFTQSSTGTTSRSGSTKASLVCVGDFNASGTLTAQDIFDFLTAWFGADSSADSNASNAITVQDVFDFLSNWFSGCL